ncbi:MAG TPA: phosphatase PAP2-related protein [Candidatus Acidoferrales bacterium]|nr:phosphatase PAP2-related protein [Candidatus Acidoferrales bacterium]
MQQTLAAQALNASLAPKLARAAIAVAGVGAWFLTQSLLGSRGFPAGIGDGLHVFLTPLTEWLAAHRGMTNLLLIVTSLVIDALGCFLLASGVTGPTVRPLLGLGLVFALRQICQALIALPPPPQMIWRNPGIPSLLVTYDTGNDFFFSGHTAIAVYGAAELWHRGHPWLKVAAALIAALEISTVLVLRAHYTMDVLTAVLAALWTFSVAVKLAPSCDRLLARAFMRRPAGVRPRS